MGADELMMFSKVGLLDFATHVMTRFTETEAVGDEDAKDVFV